MSKIKRDSRKLTSEEQYTLRVCGVRMVREEGYTKAKTAHALGVSRFAVGKWVSLYDEGGWEALKLGVRGRRKGEQAKLSNAQCSKIVVWITDKTPDQLKLPFVLWTSHAVRDLIDEKFNINCNHSAHLSTIKDYTPTSVP